MEKKFETIEYMGKTYRVVCNLNVMQEIQEKFNSFSEWSEKITGNNDKKEPSISAIKFGFLFMLNEGIEIESEETGKELKKLDSKQVGRIISEIGLVNSAQLMTKVISESVGQSQEKNA